MRILSGWGCSLLIGGDVAARDVNGTFLSLSLYVFLGDTFFAQRALFDLLHLKNLRFYVLIMLLPLPGLVVSGVYIISPDI